MDCRYAQTVSMMIDGELSEAENEQIETHILGCAACRKTEKNFRLLREQIKAARENYAEHSTGRRILSVPGAVPRRKNGVLIPLPVLALTLIFIAVLSAMLIISQNARKTVLPKETVVGNSNDNSPKTFPQPTGKPDGFSLARFDKGGRADVQIAPRKTREVTR